LCVIGREVLKVRFEEVTCWEGESMSELN
jgi:hypothetical protein